MSSQRGNIARKRAPKHKNIIGFKNDKYDKSEKLKKLNTMVHAGVCKHCKEVLEWKIKYSKYKPLTQARKCVKCFQKTVRDSYHIMCKPCAFKLELCAKCGKKEEIVNPLAPAADQEQNGDVQTNTWTRSRIKSGKGDDDDDDDSTDDSDFDRDDGSDVNDEAQSSQSSSTDLSTQGTDAALQKEKTPKTEGTEAQGVPELSALTLEACNNKQYV
ncbi:uncharacterized protein C9orf85 homolog [Heptranchias perlo]|uniref:uncharacterized protein C9orf85 homolog n=1 Tax=Heptranchias perlo TaxID=212740 RepID=UPI00355A0139